MFSVTKTGMNFRPLWTAKGKPTMSGMMVDRLDQVLMTFLSPCSTPPPDVLPAPPPRGVVPRFHPPAPTRRPPAEPAAPAGLPERHLLVVQVPHLPHRRHAIDEYEPHLPRPEAPG